MNEHLHARLAAILEQLRAVRGGGAPATATRGSEREAFVELLLRSCLPMPYRFGSGEVTDPYGNVSGQIDVVIENPFFPSFPLLGTSQHRLYMLEGVAMAIEVKSSADQFEEAVATMNKLRGLVIDAEWPRGTTATICTAGRVGTHTPTSFHKHMGFAVILYKGWSNAETLRKHCEKDDVEVTLQLDPAIFYARHFREENRPHIATDTSALAAFLCVVNEELQGLAEWSTNIYRRYVQREPAPDPASEDGESSA